MRTTLFLGVLLLIFQGLCAQSQLVRKDSFAIYFERSEYLKALNFSDKLYAQYKKSGDTPRKGEILIKQSEVYQKLGDTKRAMEVIYQALEMAKEAGDLRTQSVVLKQIGRLLNNRMEYRMAGRRFHEALALAKRINDKKLQDELTQAIFGLHHDSNSDSIAYYLGKTNAILRARNTDFGFYSAYKNSLAYEIKRGDTLQAERYADSSVMYARKLKSVHDLSAALSNRAAFYYYKKDFTNAKKYYDEMFRLKPGDTASTIAGDFYYTYSGILAGLGDYQNAYRYAEKSIELQDDTFGEEVNSATRDIEERYAVKRENEKQGRERLVYLIVIAVFVISLILLYFFYQNNRLKQKSKLAEIERETQQKLLSTTLDAREVERKEIAAVLHDNISALLSSAGLQLMAFSSAQGNTSEEISKTRNILKEAHDKVRDLSHELVPTLLAKFGLAYALEDMCEKYSTPNLNFQYSDNGKVTRYPEDFETRLYFITSELLNNTLKHSKATTAKLDLNADNGLNISLEDNGQGFDTTKPDGFGLTQIKARILSMQGKVSVTSKIGQGTSIRIWVPL